MKWIENWRALPRMYSVQAMAAIVAVQASRELLSAQQLAAPVPLLGVTLADVLTGLTTLLALGAIVLRAVAQFTER